MNLTKEQKILKLKCESDFMFFCRYIYKENHKRIFAVAEYHKLISKTLSDVFDGKIKRLIINIPP